MTLCLKCVFGARSNRNPKHYHKLPFRPVSSLNSYCYSFEPTSSRAEALEPSHGEDQEQKESQ